MTAAIHSAITPASKMVTLIRREFQEQRILFFYLPLFITLMVTIAIAVTAFRSYVMDIHFIGLLGNRQIVRSPEEIAMALQGFSEMPVELRARFWDQFYNQSLPILYISFWGVLFYYFQMTLFTQRRDRSILFWNSLPVNDTETILSKLAAGFLVCHGVFMVCLLLLQLLMLLVMMAYTAMFDISVWENVVLPSGILSRFAYFLGFTFLAIFWSLPVYAWLLLTSGWAKSAPFAWAMAPIVILALLELLFIGFEGEVLPHFFEHAFPIVAGTGNLRDFNPGGRMLNGEMLASILLGVAFIYGAIRLNRSEDL